MPLLDHQRDNIDRVLQVDIDGDHRFTTGMFQSGEQRRFLAKIAREGNDQYVLIALGNTGSDGFGGVATAVIDEDDLDSESL
ncbi:hypothetical protein D9M73_270000 [compost metagenome]